MRILINATNLKVGGAIQVADSICRELYKFTQHEFTVVLSTKLSKTKDAIINFNSVVAYTYDIKNNFQTLLFGRDRFLDLLVEKNRIEAVLTIFGPSLWKPKVPHLSGFAIPHLILQDSPFWKITQKSNLLKLKMKLWMIKRSFDKCADNYFTENPFITERLQQIFPKKKIYTVTNNANQVFQNPGQWKNDILLPKFDGVTLLTVAANYVHKNLQIIIPATKWLEEHRPDLKFRFVLSIREDELKGIDDQVKRHVVFLGPVQIEQVPQLYEQADIMLLPTLLECFSASYAEAMVMKRPILTTDLNFARSLCGDSALYYEATSPEALGKSIVRLADDKELRHNLVSNGERQLLTFDTFDQRAKKLIQIIETLA